MDIAIHFNKINIDDEWFLFKVVDVVRGTYDACTDTFETDFGAVYDSINGRDVDFEDYFGFPISMEDLKKNNIKGIPDELLLPTYLYTYACNCYIGYFDEFNGNIDIITIPFEDMFDLINSSNVMEEHSEMEFCVDSKVLDFIKDSKNMEEVQSKINELMDKLNQYKENVKDEQELDGTEEEIKEEQEPKKFNLRDLQDKVLSNIIAQDEAVSTVTTTIFVNKTSLNPKHKSHILIAGPSGTGKTEMINIIAEELDIPCFKADATAYTKSGYVGKDVYSMLEGLINAAGGDVKKAQNGILVIDEIDKKNDEGVSGKDVLYSLLKIMDRDVVEVDVSHYNSVSFDTSNLTIICMGAFTEIYDKKKREKEKTIGFKMNNDKLEDKIEISEDDFIKYGMPSEFMGRIGTIAYTNQFKPEDLIKILYDSNISPIKQEKEYFENLGINITFTSSYISEIASKSSNSKTGARDLKKLVKNALKYAYQDVLIRDKVKVLRLTKDTVLDNKKYYIE